MKLKNVYKNQFKKMNFLKNENMKSCRKFIFDLFLLFEKLSLLKQTFYSTNILSRNKISNRKIFLPCKTKIDV